MEGNMEQSTAVVSPIAPEEVLECKRLLRESGIESCLKHIREKQVNWKTLSLNVGIIGNSGVGKSSFINAIRDLSGDDAGAAPTSVNECTMEPTPYEHPKNPKLLFWDLPGVNTLNFPKETYLEKIKIEQYDFFLILSANRFTEIDAWLASEIESHRRKLFFVRTMINVDIKKDKKGHPKSHNAKAVIQSIRTSIADNLKAINVQVEFFLIDNYKRHKFDFESLEKQLIGNFVQLKRQALIFSLNSSNEAVVREKVSALKKQSFYTALLSAAGSTLVRNVLFDYFVLSKEIRFYMDQLGLSSKSLKAVTHLLSVDEKQFNEIVLQSLPQLAISIFDEECSKIDTFRLLLESQIDKDNQNKVSIPDEVIRFIPFVGAVMSFKTNYALLNNLLDHFQDIALKMVNLCTDKSIE